MRFQNVLPLVALTTAIVIPDDRVLNQVPIEFHKEAKSWSDKLPSAHGFISKAESVYKNVLDNVETTFNEVQEVGEELEHNYMDTAAWLGESEDDQDDEGHGGHGRHGRHGKHGRHHHKPNLTVYELIAKSKYTTKLAKLINEYDDLVELFNSTKANFTIFAPTDRAFAKIPDHGRKPSKEFLKSLLQYHASDYFYPAGRVLASQTIPTLLHGEGLSTSPADTPQRLSVAIGLRGLTLNFYSRIVAINIFGTNGVIHGVDSILIPPPTVAESLAFLPTQFSTVELGLFKTDLLSTIADTSNHLGGTFFAPTNFAFKLLGPRANGFLFSKWGQKYLKALLKYHVVANQTLYSDAFYGADDSKTATSARHFHVDLPTLLGDKYLRIDIARFARFVKIRINGFTDVTEPDLVTYDGVIQPVGRVLIPPKTTGAVTDEYDGGEISVEELSERLEPYVEEDKAEADAFDLWSEL